MTYIPSVNNMVDSGNSTVIPLAANVTFTGSITDVSKYTSIFLSLTTDVASAIIGFKLSFSVDGINFTTNDHDEFSITANQYFTHTTIVEAKYFRLTYLNGASPQTIFRLQTLLTLVGPTTYTNDSNDLLPTTSSTFTTTKITGLQPNNQKYAEIKADNEALTVSIVSPTTSFGEVNTAENEAVVQGDFVYGISPYVFKSITSGTGSTVTSSPNLAIVRSGTVAKSLGYLQTLRNARYRSGQGIISRFTTIFTTGVAGNYQLAGVGNFKSGVYFGYKDTIFGINRLAGGILAIQTLTVTTAATTGTATITLFDGAVARVFSVPVTTTVPVAPQLGTEITAAQIASFDFTTQYPGWIASSNGAVVTFICILAQPNNTMTVSFSAAGAATTANLITGFVPIGAGAGGEDEFVPRSSWNVDVMDGTNSEFNPSGMLLDPTKGNVFQITIQYLGFGGINFFIENPNNGRFQLVHTIKYANTFTVTNLKVPNLSFQVFSRNISNTTAVSTYASSCYIAVQGVIKELGLLRTYTSPITYALPGSATEFQLFAVRPSVIFSGQYSVINIVPTSLLLANDDPDSFIVYLYLTPTTYQASKISWSNSGITANAYSSILIGSQPNSATLPTSATGGVLLASINVPTSTSVTIDLSPYNLQLNYFQTLSIGITSLAAVSAGVWSVGLQWVEQQ